MKGHATVCLLAAALGAIFLGADTPAQEVPPNIGKTLGKKGGRAWLT